MLFAVQNNVAGIGVVQQCSRNPSKHIHGVAPGRPQCDCLIRCMISYIPPGSLQLCYQWTLICDVFSAATPTHLYR